MDPSWLRCFKEHYIHEDKVVRPYSDIEEELITQYIEFIRAHGWKYGIEQTLVLRHFLERNPDLFDEVKEMIQSGNFEILGGGEAVIDYNLTSGESIYRNHYYSIKYCEETFGCRPKYADCPDTFGLSAQLPQIFRQFGYDAITQYDRVFGESKPVWRGLDGSMIGLWSIVKVFNHFAPDCYKYVPCEACHGEGCEICRGTGIDFSYDFSYHEAPHGDRDGLVFYAGPPCSTEEYIKKFAESDAEENIMYVSSEETRLYDTFPEKLSELCRQYDIELCPMTAAEILEYKAADMLGAVRSGNAPEDMVDHRTEGNPMATGCYTSRIELKRRNRMLEQLVLSAEKMASLAFEPEKYPHKKFARIWSMKSFLQFHDCITASHCDASYEELLRTCREIHTAAGRIRNDAMKILARNVKAEAKDGWQCVVVFNPTSKEWNDVPLSAVIRQKDVFESAELCDENGNRIPVLSIKVQNNQLDCAAEVSFRATVPAMGSYVVYWRPSAPISPVVTDGNCIENEYFRISPEGITDKIRGIRIFDENAGGLAASHHYGDAWGRHRPEEWTMSLADSEVKTVSVDGALSLEYSGSYSDPERGIESLSWTRTATLYSGVDKIFWHTEIDWKGENVRISARFPLAIDHGDSGFYEIPYGMLERRDEIVPTGYLGFEDEWPAINWFAAYDKTKDYSAVLYNKGIPGSRICGSTMEMSLLRSPTAPGVINPGARDYGHHVYDYAVSVCDGKPDAADPTAFGLRYTTTVPSAPAVYENSGTLSIPTITTDGTSVHITAIKRDENGSLILRAAESYGKEAVLTLPVPAAEVDPLEEKLIKAPSSEIVFRPFEIKTLRI